MTSIAFCTSLFFKIVERERKLNVALLRSGKFKEALETLMDWMTKTDEMLSNQKLSSTDYKVLKSQLQMQQVSYRQLLQQVINVDRVFNDLACLMREINLSFELIISNPSFVQQCCVK